MTTLLSTRLTEAARTMDALLPEVTHVLAFAPLDLAEVSDDIRDDMGDLWWRDARVEARLMGMTLRLACAEGLWAGDVYVLPVTTDRANWMRELADRIGGNLTPNQISDVEVAVFVRSLDGNLIAVID